MAEIFKVLGLDLGTNSIGYAIRDRNAVVSDEESLRASILKAGVSVFTTPMLMEKGVESGSLASQRTTFRSMRKRIARRRKRKQELLIELSKLNMVPLSSEEVMNWQKKKAAYPKENEAFVKWLKMDFDASGKPNFICPYEVAEEVKQLLGPNWKDTLANPYLLRAQAIEHPEDITEHMLGRIAYHFIQRRGYQSNRKELAAQETSEESTELDEKPKKGKRSKGQDGEDENKALDTKKVLSSIENNLAELKESGLTVGQVLAKRLLKWQQEDGTPERARNRLGTMANHFGRPALREEWRAIVGAVLKARGIENEEHAWYKLEDVIFRNRPLKSQKRNIGKCLLEPNKFRMPVSHPVFELFRTWQVINNIRYCQTVEVVATQTGTGKSQKKTRPLNDKMVLDGNLQELTLEQKGALLQRLLERKSNFTGKSLKSEVDKVLGFGRNEGVSLNYPEGSSFAGNAFWATCIKELGKERTEQLYQLAVERLEVEERQQDGNWQQDPELKEKWADLKNEGPDLFVIWKWLFEADTEQDLKFLSDRLFRKFQIQPEQSKNLWKSIKEGYGMLSLRATFNILRMMQEGYRYDEAALFAKLPKLLGHAFWKRSGSAFLASYVENRKLAEHENAAKTIANSWLSDYNRSIDPNDDQRKPYRDEPSNLDDEDVARLEALGIHILKENSAEASAALLDRALELVSAKVSVGTRYQERGERQLAQQSIWTFGLYEKETTLDTLVLNVLAHCEDGSLTEQKVRKALYHHSDVETSFKHLGAKAEGNENLLPSPITNSLRNPVVLRALNQLRRLVNHLIKTGEIDPETTAIQLELSRELNTANMRKAIERYQLANQKLRETAKAKIESHFAENQIDRTVQDTDILKYLLWEEQGRRCLYTDDTIHMSDLFSSNPLFDIEHTIPQSRYPDSEMENLSICKGSYNRQVKRGQFAGDLPEFDDTIKPRLNVFQVKLDEAKNRAERAKGSVKTASTKEAKDKAMVNRHLAQMDVTYFKQKLKCFYEKQATFTGGFRKRQAKDTDTINRYAIDFLKTKFAVVKGSKGEVTSLVRKAWQLTDADAKKDRNFHYHHAEDAVVQTFLFQKGGEEGPYRLVSELKRGAGVLFERYKHLLDETGDYQQQLDKFLSLLRKPAFTPGKLKPEAVRSVVKSVTDQVLVYHAPVSSPLKQTKRLRRDARGRIVRSETEKSQENVSKLISGIRAKLHKETFYGRIVVKDESGVPEVRFRETVLVSSLDTKTIEQIVDVRIRQLARDAGEAGCQKLGYLELPPSAENQAKGKNTPQRVYKVKVFSSEKSPIRVKKHLNPLGLSGGAERFAKAKDKSALYAKNDSNFLLKTIPDKKGVSFKPINALELFKLAGENPVVLSLGSTVVFYENHPEEINWNDPADLKMRLYILKIIEGSGRLTFRRSELASDTPEMGRGENKFSVSSSPSKMRLSRAEWKFLVVDGSTLSQLPDGSFIKQ